MNNNCRAYRSHCRTWARVKFALSSLLLTHFFCVFVCKLRCGVVVGRNQCETQQILFVFVFAY